MMLSGIIFILVNAHDNRNVFVFRRRGNHNFFHRFMQMFFRIFRIGKATGGFNDYFGAVCTPGNLRRIQFLSDFDFFPVNDKRGAFDFNFRIDFAMHGIVLQ